MFISQSGIPQVTRLKREVGFAVNKQIPKILIFRRAIHDCRFTPDGYRDHVLKSKKPYSKFLPALLYELLNNPWKWPRWLAC